MTSANNKSQRCAVSRFELSREEMQQVQGGYDLASDSPDTSLEYVRDAASGMASGKRAHRPLT